MALEILGAVASSIAIVEAAGKIGKHAIALKRLCDEVKDVPQTLQDQIDQLNCLGPILDRLESEFAKAPDLLQEDSIAKQSLDCYRQAASDLEELVRKLQSQINAAKEKSFKRTVEKLRVRLKKNLVDDLERKLEKALRLLNLAHNTYQTSLTTRAVMELVTVKRQMLKFEERATLAFNSPSIAHISPDSLFGPKENCSNRQRQTLSHLISTRRLGWQDFGYLPRLSYDTVDASAVISKTGEDTQDEQNKVTQINFRLPFWIARKVWDLQVNRAYGQWTASLKTWNIRDWDSEIFELVSLGETEAILNAFRSGSASPYDCFPSGDTILDMALFNFQLDTARVLVETKSVMNGWSQSVTIALHECYIDSTKLSQCIQILANYCTYADENDLDYNSDDIKREACEMLAGMVWDAPEHTMMLIEGLSLDFDAAASRFNFTRLSWRKIAKPENLTLWLDQQEIPPSTFREYMIEGTCSSAMDFAYMYFVGGLVAYRSSWREATRWIFRCADASKLTNSSRNWQHSFVESLSPLCALARLAPLSSKSHSIYWGVNRESVLFNWLEDLAIAGVDLWSMASWKVPNLQRCTTMYILSMGFLVNDGVMTGIRLHIASNTALDQKTGASSSDLRPWTLR